MAIKTLLAIFIMLQVTTGGIYVDSGTYDIFDNEQFPVGEALPFGLVIQSGASSTDNYWLHRITFVWFSFTIHQLFNETGHEQENATINAQLSPYEIRELGKGDDYSFYPNSTLYHTRGKTNYVFPVEFILTDDGYNITTCIVSGVWSLEWEYRLVEDYTFQIIIVLGLVALSVPIFYCLFKRRRYRAEAEVSQVKLSETRAKKKQKKDAKKVERSGQK